MYLAYKYCKLKIYRTITLNLILHGHAFTDSSDVDPLLNSCVATNENHLYVISNNFHMHSMDLNNDVSPQNIWTDISGNNIMRMSYTLSVNSQGNKSCLHFQPLIATNKYLFCPTVDKGININTILDSDIYLNYTNNNFQNLLAIYCNGSYPLNTYVL